MTTSKNDNQSPFLKPFFLKHTVQPYGKELIVSAAYTLEGAYNNALKKLKATEADFERPDTFGESSAMCFRRSNGSGLILFAYPLLSAEIVVHEVEHFTNNMFGRVGLKWTFSGCEAFAYMKDYIFGLIVRNLSAAGFHTPLFL